MWILYLRISDGTATCVAAGRLAKGESSSQNPLDYFFEICGPNNFNNPLVTNPAAFIKHLAPESKNTLFYKCQPSPLLNNRETLVATGGCLGSGSSINFMMYNRAQVIDFDSWDTPGWAAKDMIPLCKKLETYHAKGHDMSVHGTDGPIHVSDGGFGGSCGEVILRTSKEMGLTDTADMVDFAKADGFSKFYRYVSPDGKIIKSASNRWKDSWLLRRSPFIRETGNFQNCP